MGLFYSGKIYLTAYANWKNDSKPLTFILYSDTMKTHAINLHYFPQPLLVQFIMFVKKFSQQFPTVNPKLGRILYRVMKRHYPMWVKQAYRTYHTPQLNGYLINEGVTMPLNSFIKPTTPEEMVNRDLQASTLNHNLQDSSVSSKMPSRPSPVSFFKMK